MNEKDEAFYRWQHWYEPTSFMTLEQFIARVRKDLNDPKVSFMDMPVPRNEEEYQSALDLFKLIKERQKARRK